MAKIKAEYINHMGNDFTVVNAARVSFSKESGGSDYEWEVFKDGNDYVSFKMNEKDRRLISYLAKHNHWTPFSHPQITLRFTVPIFVARQEFKHIVGFTRNEVSRRYVDDEPAFFIPEVWRGRPDGSIKQGSGEPILENGIISDMYSDFLKEAVDLYDAMLVAGVAPEMARMVLPQSMMTSYYVTGSLAAFARMYKQRSDGHAQEEIQELAAQVGKIVAPLYPQSWKALVE